MKRNRTPHQADPRSRSRDRAGDGDFWEDEEAGDARRPAAPAGGSRPPDRHGSRDAGYYNHGAASHGAAADGAGAAGSGEHGGDRGPQRWRESDVISPAGTPVAFRTSTGWRVGEEEVSDLTSAMVLADLLAADLPAGGGPPAGQREQARSQPEPEPREELDPRKLQETVAQLEHALRVRVRVEQAIGVLAERHRLRPRQAFELLRSAARVRGRRVLEVAGEVVESATNPLLRIPEELAKPPAPRRRGRVGRHSFGAE